MIAQGLMLGISKRELFEDYYPEELAALISEWNVLHKLPDKDEVEDLGKVSIESFLSM